MDNKGVNNIGFDEHEGNIEMYINPQTCDEIYIIVYHSEIIPQPRELHLRVLDTNHASMELNALIWVEMT